MDKMAANGFSAFIVGFGLWILNCWPSLCYTGFMGLRRCRPVGGQHF